jgi:hypothetical protein
MIMSELSDVEGAIGHRYWSADGGHLSPLMVALLVLRKSTLGLRF